MTVRLKAFVWEGAPAYRMLGIETSRGYKPIASWRGRSWRIYAGCRDYTVKEAISHWGAKRYGWQAACGLPYCRMCSPAVPSKGAAARGQRYCKAIRMLPPKPSSRVFDKLLKSKAR